MCVNKVTASSSCDILAVDALVVSAEKKLSKHSRAVQQKYFDVMVGWEATRKNITYNGFLTILVKMRLIKWPIFCSLQWMVSIIYFDTFYSLFKTKDEIANINTFYSAFSSWHWFYLEMMARDAFGLVRSSKNQLPFIEWTQYLFIRLVHLSTACA